jgi:hypothetical protein
MPNTDHLILLRTLRGAPLSCLVLLRLENRPIDESYLEMGTGYDRETIHEAIQYLNRYDFILSRDGVNWISTKKAEQINAKG